ncbi:MAG: LLM class flavin-dependent oxidoreductase [Chloroflexi bacterium]|nr:LLM class flavin-dependent oxidoreductase [Chloroflexota bacterium]
MRFYWFHLMPYQDLPADFSQKYPSVWVTPPSSRLYDPAAGHRMYNEYLDELEHAAEAGFDGVCVNEHHQNAYGMMPSPNIMAATLARNTKRSAIVVLGNSIALYNPPIRVAEELAMLDVMSGGRLVAGFPVGSSMDTNYCYGATPATLREKYQEAHDLIMRAWMEPEPFAFNGKYTQLRYVNVWPRPLQKPHPPVWVPGGGSIETWAWVAERNYSYSYLSFSGYKRGEQVMQGYWRTLDEMGLKRNPYRGGFLQLICVAPTDAEAERIYAPHVDYFYDKCLHIAAGFAEAPGYRTVKTIAAGLSSQFAPTQRQQRQQSGKRMTWKDYIEQGFIVAGSPATVREQLKDVITRLHVGHLMCLLHLGNMPRETTLMNTDLFAREVMPHLRGLWSEWRDEWYPKALPERAMQTPAARAR